MYMKNLLAILMMLTGASPCWAQYPNWIREYSVPNSNADSYVTQMQTLSGPNHAVYVSAGIQQGVLGSNLILKYSESGTLEWMRSEDSSELFSSGLITLDKTGAVYQCGIKHSTLWSSYLNKFSPDGNILWQHTSQFPNKRATANYVLTNDSDQVVLLTCWQNVFTVTKYSPGGDELWNYVDSANDNQLPAIMNLDPDGNILVCANPLDNTLLVKLDGMGKKQWSKSLNASPGYFYTVSIQMDKSGCIYLLSNPETVDNTCHIAVSKLDPKGSQIWQHEYFNNSDCNKARGLVLDKNANLYAAASLHPNSGFKDSLVLLNLDSAGQLLHTLYYSGRTSVDDIPTAIALDATNNCYITGQSIIDGLGETFIVEWNSSAELFDSVHYSFLQSNDEAAYSIAVNESGEVFISGTTKDNNQKGIFTMGFSKFTGLKNETPNELSLLIYPNPAKDEITLRSNPHETFRTALIYDAIGKLIKQVVVSATNTVDIGDLASGMYQCIAIDQRGLAFSSKLVIVR